MKRITLLLFSLIIISIIFTSCYSYNNSIDPKNQPMSKWEADGLELYVTDYNQGLMLFYFEDKTIAYDVFFIEGDKMLLCDRRLQSGVLDDYEHELLNEEKYDNLGCVVASLSYTSLNKRVFKATISEHYIKTNQFPLQEFIFKRTAIDLKTDDIPNVVIDEKYSYCPVYSLASKWTDNNNNIVVDIENKFVMTSVPYYRCPIGYITLNDETFNIVFSEINSMAYIGHLQVLGGFEYDTKQASDKWKCEFFENYFVATVIESNYYEKGTVLTFYKSN